MTRFVLPRTAHLYIDDLTSNQTYLETVII